MKLEISNFAHICTAVSTNEEMQNWGPKNTKLGHLTLRDPFDLILHFFR